MWIAAFVEVTAVLEVKPAVVQTGLLVTVRDQDMHAEALSVPHPLLQL
jgi:hypothetical protein